MRETLAEIYERHAVYDGDVGCGDKGTTHSYIEEYEELLAPYRDRCAFMEIGLSGGPSVRMWGEYFGPECDLTWVDVSMILDPWDESYNPWDYSRWNLVKADATKPELLDALGDRTFDVVIDDASHLIEHQVATKDMLLPRMNPGGLYIIEDILWLDYARTVLVGAEIRDFRSKKGRWDDALVIYRT